MQSFGKTTTMSLQTATVVYIGGRTRVHKQTNKRMAIKVRWLQANGWALSPLTTHFWHTIKYHRIKYIDATDRRFINSLTVGINLKTIHVDRCVCVFWFTSNGITGFVDIFHHHTASIESAKDFNDINRFLLYIILFFHLPILLLLLTWPQRQITKISKRRQNAVKIENYVIFYEKNTEMQLLVVGVAYTLRTLVPVKIQFI